MGKNAISFSILLTLKVFWPDPLWSSMISWFSCGSITTFQAKVRLPRQLPFWVSVRFPILGFPMLPKDRFTKSVISYHKGQVWLKGYNLPKLQEIMENVKKYVHGLFTAFSLTFHAFFTFFFTFIIHVLISSKLPIFTKARSNLGVVTGWVFAVLWSSGFVSSCFQGCRTVGRPLAFGPGFHR